MINVTSLQPSTSSTEEIFPLILQLGTPHERESALSELSKRREVCPEMAPILWYSFGTISVLLQEIIMVYPMLSPPVLSSNSSTRVCNALALLQCVASHPETKQKFMGAHVPLYLYPFLNTVSKHRAFEYLRLTSLGVIGALVKVDDSEVVSFLLQTEIVPLCLRIMENGSELSKTVATFIVQKVLLDDVGLAYICANTERFYAISTVLAGMVSNLVENPSVRLLKHVVRCYLRLSEQQRSRKALKKCLPGPLKDLTFATTLKSEETVLKWLQQLVRNCNEADVDVTQIGQLQPNFGLESANGLTNNTNLSANKNNPDFSAIDYHNVGSNNNNSEHYGRAPYSIR